jgi:four helix bundle protein
MSSSHQVVSNERRTAQLAKVRKFEDLRAWQMAKDLAAAVYKVTDGERFAKDFGLRDQIRRAAVSAMSNIAEGFERDTDKELQRFLYMAKGSIGEVRSQLHLAADLGYLRPTESADLRDKAERISKSVSAFITYLSGRSRSGVRSDLKT